MPIVANRYLNSYADMVAAIRAIQIDAGRPVSLAIDNQSVGQQIVLLQQYGATQGWYDPTKVRRYIADSALAEELVAVQLAYLAGASYPSWVLRTPDGQPATWQADFVNSQFWFNGASYPSFTTWLAAMGGTFTRSNTSASAGYYRDASGIWQAAPADTLRAPHYAQNLTPLGAMFEGSQQSVCLAARDLTSVLWTKSNATATRSAGITGIANSGSRLTATANGGYATQAVSTTASARQLGVWMKRVAGSGAINLSVDGGVTPVDVSGLINSSTFTLVPVPATSATSLDLRLSLAISGDAVDVDMFQMAGPFASSPIATGGANLTRNADILNFPINALTEGSLVVAARSGLGLTANPAYIINLDNGSSTQSILVQRNSAGSLQCAASISSVTQGLNDFGSYASDTDFKVAYAFKNGSFKASLNGASNQDSVPQGTVPAINQFRMVSSFAGYSPIKMMALLPKAVATEYLPIYSQNTPNPLLGAGDSYMSGASGVSMAGSLFALNSRPVDNIGAGGATLDQIRDAYIAQPAAIKQRTTVFWDGSPNGYGTPAAYMAIYAQIVAAIPHSRFVILPPVIRSIMSGQEQADTQTIRTALLSTYPSNTIDVQAVLGNPVSGGNLQGDNTHLNSTGMGLSATPVNNMLVTNGW